MSMGALNEFQHAFKAALLAPADAVRLAGFARQPGFAVYRNTVMKAWIDALQANYPSVARLVGEDWFRAAAALYAARHPAHDPCLLHHGPRFAEFLAAFEPAAALPYLPGVAQLDRLRTECHVAADAAPLAAQALAGLTPEELGASVLHPHPAARWAWFDDVPVFTIWRANNEGDAHAAGDIDWQAEGALFTRPHDSVCWTALDAGGVAFLAACAAGATLAEASARTLAAAPQTDLARLLAALLRAGTFADAPGPAEHS
jgi:hypothetical protein